MSVIKKKGQKWVVKEKDKGDKEGKHLSPEFDTEADAKKAKRKIDGGTVRKTVMKYSGRKSK